MSHLDPSGRTSKVTIHTLKNMKQAGEKITMLTAYDASFARLLDKSGVDALLVGDSLGMVIKGEDNTLGVTLDEMIYHCRAVSRGARRAHLVGDMPFMTYQVSPAQALISAGRMVSEGKVEAVKLEGGREYAETVAKLWGAGIPVMGHLGLTPQSVHKLGGFVMQGRKEEQALRLLEDAKILQEAGCYALVLECIPGKLAEEISQSLSIPTIGIGAGPACDGQVLVCYDLLGMDANFSPKFLKKFANLDETISAAVQNYILEVKDARFPVQPPAIH